MSTKKNTAMADAANQPDPESTPKAAAKAGAQPAKAGAQVTGAKRKPAKSPKRSRRASAKNEPSVIPRSTSGFSEDDILMNGGGGAVGFGRCGGRMMSSSIEQQICDRLSRAGVTHSHTPRHFEVTLGEAVAAYSPMIVLRGRGREGKTLVIEASETIDPLTLQKIQAFRDRYGPEFYIVFVAPEETIDEIPVTAYDESCVTTDLNTLVSRLAE